MIFLGLANDQEVQLVRAVGAKADQVSAAAKAAWNLWLAVRRSEWGTLQAAASGDQVEAYRQSETCRLLATFMVETMVTVHNEYVESSAFKRGEIKGRVTLEALLIILPFTKASEAGQISKVAALTKLSEVQWIKENP